MYYRKIVDFLIFMGFIKYRCTTVKSTLDVLYKLLIANYEKNCYVSKVSSTHWGESDSRHRF